MVEEMVCRLSLLGCHGEEDGVKAVIARKSWFEKRVCSLSWQGCHG
jgi:hypothetical protein